MNVFFKNNFSSCINNGGLLEVERLPGSFVFCVCQVFEKLINAEHLHLNVHF